MPSKNLIKLARLIATEEGFFKSGSLPQRRNNPGDLRHATHGSHEGIDPDAIAIESSTEDGWNDLYRQIKLDAERAMTVESFVFTYAPPSENNSEQYITFLCQGMNCTRHDFLNDIIR